MKKTNPFIKPSGPMKGSSTMAVRGDTKKAPASRLVNNKGIKLNSQIFGSSTSKNSPTDKIKSPSTVKAMVKVMKAYPSTKGTPAPKKVVTNNQSTIEKGKSMPYLPR